MLFLQYNLNDLFYISELNERCEPFIPNIFQRRFNQNLRLTSSLTKVKPFELLTLFYIMHWYENAKNPFISRQLLFVKA